MNRHTLLYIYMVACMAMMFVACNKRTIFNHYESTPVKGWERNDTLSFYIEPIQETGLYQEEVGLRINGEYPYLGLSLIVEQTLQPTNVVYSDTLICNLIDKEGRAHGRGINHLQYMFTLTTLKLNKGESVHVAIRHCMKREILPGVIDVGLKLTRQIATGIQTEKDEKQEGKAPQ